MLGHHVVVQIINGICVAITHIIFGSRKCTRAEIYQGGNIPGRKFTRAEIYQGGNIPGQKFTRADICQGENITRTSWNAIVWIE